MENKKSVIRIIKKASNFNGYDEHYYLADIVTDIDGHLMARNTGNIWDAMKFKSIENCSRDELNRIESLINFVKTCYTPHKDYQIQLISLNLSY